MVYYSPGVDLADRSGNCKPGLVVDDGIVHSKLMDFYLQSHAGIIGSKCIVIHLCAASNNPVKYS